MSSMPVTAQRTAWPQETAAPTTGLSAKVGDFHVFCFNVICRKFSKPCLRWRRQSSLITYFNLNVPITFGQILYIAVLFALECPSCIF